MRSARNTAKVRNRGGRLDALRRISYLRDMRMVIGRLILLGAMLLLPLGMNPGMAAPAHGLQAATMPMRHCPEQAPAHGSKAGFAECTMACSAALPAVDLAAHAPPMIVCLPVAAAVEQRLHGLHPDTATPPPKRG